VPVGILGTAEDAKLDWLQPNVESAMKFAK
jgi:hypothetical protein